MCGGIVFDMTAECAPVVQNYAVAQRVRASEKAPRRSEISRLCNVQSQKSQGGRVSFDAVELRLAHPTVRTTVQ